MVRYIKTKTNKLSKGYLFVSSGAICWCHEGPDSRHTFKNDFRMTFYLLGRGNDIHSMGRLGKLVMTKDYFRMEWDCDALDYPNKHKVS